MLQSFQTISGDPYLPSTKERWLMSVVISDAMDNIDIAQKYADFHERLLLEADLRHHFIEMLDAVLHPPIATDSKQALPETLSALYEILPLVEISMDKEGKTELHWHLSPLQLTYLLDKHSLPLRVIDDGAQFFSQNIQIQATILQEKEDLLKIQVVWRGKIEEQTITTRVKWGNFAQEKIAHANEQKTTFIIHPNKISQTGPTSFPLDITVFCQFRFPNKR